MSEKKHETCVETTGVAELASGTRSWMCSRLCPTGERVKYVNGPGSPGFVMETIRAMMVQLDRPARDEVARMFAASYANETAGPAAPDFSMRQWEILRLLAAGNSTKEIAAILFITEQTIANYLLRMNEKMGTNNRVQLIAAAYRLGML